MQVSIEVVCGKERVKRAMIATMGVTRLSNKEKWDEMLAVPMSDKTWKTLLLGRHSPIEEYVVWIDAIVPERVHTHVVRHEDIGKYVATSRPDLRHCSELGAGMRVLSLSINAKRLIEISERRLCFSAWSGTRDLFIAIKNQMKQIDEHLYTMLVPPCVHRGMCTELNTDCGFIDTSLAIEERNALLELGGQLG